PHAWPPARTEAGTHLFLPRDAPPAPVQVAALPLADGADPTEIVRARLAERAAWLAALEAGRAAVEGDPFAPGPVVRVYEGGEVLGRPEYVRAVDPRTGVAAELPQWGALLGGVLDQDFVSPAGER